MIFLCEDFLLRSDKIIAPAIIPQSIERNTIIASDASNFQKKKVISTGRAFCIENTATTKITINNKITIAIISSP